MRPIERIIMEEFVVRVFREFQIPISEMSEPIFNCVLNGHDSENEEEIQNGDRI